MTKKLNLSDFLANCDTPLTEPVKVRKEESEVLSFPLNEFCTELSTYDGMFSIDNRLFGNVILSANSLYFFNEDNNEDYMIIFDPIIDIKKRETGFNVFYYPSQVINIILKESYVEKKQISTTSDES